MEPFDKQIHADEFKLRLLVTDGCNFNCKFCLNDFQPKPQGDTQYISVVEASRAIGAYATTFKDKYPLQVYFSGGEPTLHPMLPTMLGIANTYGCRVTLNTNGSFSDELEPVIHKLVHCLHFGVYGIDPKLAGRISRMRGDVQCVYSTQHPYVDYKFIEYYLSYGLRIKVFGDLHEDSTAYTEFAEDLLQRYSGEALSFRHKGVQENRGIGCNNCDRYCVTLKGGWVFPNNTVSHCPQKCKGTIYSPSTQLEWSDALTQIELAHRKQSL